MSPQTGHGSAGTAADERLLKVLVVCTGNICRSPMGEGLLRSEATHAGLAVQVASAGVQAVSGPADPHAVRSMQARGIDISAHRAHQFTSVDAAASDLILTMERSHVVRIVADAPDATAALGIVFTLPEFVRLGHEVGPLGDADLEGWLVAVAGLRNPAAMLRADPDDEVDDPYGRGRRAFNRCADELTELTGAVVDLLSR